MIFLWDWERKKGKWACDLSKNSPRLIEIRKNIEVPFYKLEELVKLCHHWSIFMIGGVRDLGLQD